MTFVNQFVAKQLPTMRQFLHSISTPAYPSNGLALSRPIAERLSVSSSMENGFPSPTGDNMLSRVSGSQSHHAGFQAPPMLATTTPINPASVGANSIHCPDSSSSQFVCATQAILLFV